MKIVQNGIFTRIVKLTINQRSHKSVRFVIFQDEDPYVRKTAAVCVAKLHDINAQLVEDQGFLDQLRDLLSDSNPMVKVNLYNQTFTNIIIQCISCLCYFQAKYKLQPFYS